MPSTGFHVRCRSRVCERIFRKIKEDVATGPDCLHARILRFIGPLIAMPFTTIVQKMVDAGHWPDEWRIHRLVPLFKRNQYFLPGNYRGLHITSLLSKVAERLIAHTLSPFLQHHGYGERQWAYRKGRGAKDLICYIMLTWILAICSGESIGVYLSDISGAFDQVYSKLFLVKLRQLGLSERMLIFFVAYLDARVAHSVVGGSSSNDYSITDMVFQCTVLAHALE